MKADKASLLGLQAPAPNTGFLGSGSLFRVVCTKMGVTLGQVPEILLGSMNHECPH